MANEASKSTTNAGRSPYRTPNLVAYGSVAKLTQGTTSNGSDGGAGAGMMNGVCL